MRDLKLITPTMPDSISIDLGLPPGTRQDGFRPVPQISVAELSKEEAEEYAERMKQTFIKHWQGLFIPQTNTA
jgi:hypothetical protein